MTKLHLRPVYEPALQPQYPWDFDVFEEEAMNARDLRKKGISLKAHIGMLAVFGGCIAIMALAFYGAYCLWLGIVGL